MATNLEDTKLFQEQKAKDKLIIRDLPKFDLESYISNYDGYLRIQRLLAIAQTSTFLSADAFRLAILQAKEGTDTHLYHNIVETFKKLLPDDPLTQLDTEWMQKKNNKIKAETNRLEYELKAYKNNLIKESIRMGNEDLANHFFAIGDLPSAFKAYSRMRDYCTTPRHIAELTMKQLHVSVAQSNWVVAQSYYLKVNALSLKEDERAKYDPILHACLGLAHLQQGSYREAANSFLNIAPSYMNPEVVAGINFQREIISPNDIAVYGGLTALATMNRTELQRRVLDNTSFRQFLELESHLRRAISMFCAAKYTGCMAILESYRTDYMLDLFLQDHFLKLYWMVRGKSIVQWFSAFSVVTLDALAKAFPTPPEYAGTIEQELGAMIRAGRLKARIDLVDRLLISPDQDARFAVMENGLRMANQAEKSLRLKLHRVNMTATGLEIKSPKNQGQDGFDTFAAAGGGEGASGLGGSAGQAFRNLKGKLTKGSSGLGLGGGLTAYMS